MKKFFVFLIALLIIKVLCIPAFADEAVKIELTLEEQEYLEVLGPVTMGVDPDWVPFELLDDEGNFTGIAADLIELVSKRLDIEIELVITEDWNETLERSRAGDFHIIPFLNQTPEREEWLIFTDPIFTDPNVLITREEHPFIADPSELADATIVLPYGTSIEEFVRRDFPNLTVINTETEMEAFRMVSDREADMTLRSLIIAAYTIRNEGFFNLKISGQIPEYTNNLRIGVLQSEPMLRDILNKGVSSITPRERQDIVNKYVYILVEEPVNYRLIIGISLSVILISLIVFYWNIKLNRLKARAEAASKAKSEFLANMSHELRTPLNAILGYAQILKRNPELYKTQKKGLDIIENSGNHLLNLIDEILDISKIEARKMQLVNEPFAFEEFLTGIAEMVRIKAVQKSIDFYYETEGSIPETVTGDHKRLGQVLLNILGNAVKFTEEGYVSFKVKCIDDKVTFIVSDTGTGIDNEYLEEIFLPFSQVGRDEQKVQGTGLGLAISRKIINLMGSDLMVESKKGLGSKFYFTVSLPKTDRTVSGKKETGKIIGYKGPILKILVADDKKYNRAVLRDYLEQIGFVIIEAENGEEAVKIALSEKPNLVLMDIFMPLMDGYEASGRIRERFGSSQVRIIALSASILKDDIEKSYESGMDDYLAKPVIFESLTKKIEKNLGINWKYEKESEKTRNKESISKDFECPGRKILEDLYSIAVSGNPARLISEIDKLTAEEEINATFYVEIKKMCEDLKMNQVRNILEKCLGDISDD